MSNDAVVEMTGANISVFVGKIALGIRALLSAMTMLKGVHLSADPIAENFLILYVPVPSVRACGITM